MMMEIARHLHLPTVSMDDFQWFRYFIYLTQVHLLLLVMYNVSIRRDIYAIVDAMSIIFCMLELHINSPNSHRDTVAPKKRLLMPCLLSFVS